MNTLKMPQSNSRPTSPRPIDGNVDCLGHQLVVAKTEMLTEEVADAAASHSEQRDGTSDNPNYCDIRVKTENDLSVDSLIDSKSNCGKGADSGDDRPPDAKAPNGQRSKLIYSCHRCKSIFNSRISFESHYK